MGGWKVTVRHGSEVEKESFDGLDAAIAEVERTAGRISSEGGLPPASGFRDYGPGELVQARIEVSGRGVLRKREGGIDVMGDGGLVPYAGVVNKKPLRPSEGESPIEALRRALEG
jgi:hypothetical protein